MTKITHEEIDNMEAGRKMDELVATLVMEWSSTSGYDWRDKHGEYTAGRAWYHDHTFEPSNDIASAWQVVEKMKLAIIPLTGDDKWIAKTNNDGIYADGEKEKGALIGWPELHWLTNIAVANTAPLAICRAALKAVTP